MLLLVLYSLSLFTRRSPPKRYTLLSIILHAAAAAAAALQVFDDPSRCGGAGCLHHARSSVTNPVFAVRFTSAIFKFVCDAPVRCVVGGGGFLYSDSSIAIRNGGAIIAIVAVDRLDEWYGICLFFLYRRWKTLREKKKRLTLRITRNRSPCPRIKCHPSVNYTCLDPFALMLRLKPAYSETRKNKIGITKKPGRSIENMRVLVCYDFNAK